MQGSLHLCRWHLPFWCPVEALVSILPLWKRHPSSSNPKPVLCCQCASSKIHIVFLVHLLMRNVDMAWQTRSVLDAQKALVRRKMVQISFLWYSEPVPLWTWLFLYFLLVGETDWISAVAALGWYLETTFRSWSCVRCYYKRVFVIWGGLSLHVVNFYCSLLVLSELWWSILTGYRETFEMEEQWMIHSRQSL